MKVNKQTSETRNDWLSTYIRGKNEIWVNLILLQFSLTNTLYTLSISMSFVSTGSSNTNCDHLWQWGTTSQRNTKADEKSYISIILLCLLLCTTDGAYLWCMEFYIIDNGTAQLLPSKQHLRCLFSVMYLLWVMNDFFSLTGMKLEHRQQNWTGQKP